MKLIQVDSNGGPEVLRPITSAAIEPAAGHLLVEVEAAGINFVDVYQRSGVYNRPKPYVPGLEGVGRVRQVGDKASGFAEGDRVAWINVPGSYAELVSVPVQQAIAIPATFGVEQALLFQAVTAQYLVKEYRALKSGDIALVHAAAGGMGQLLVQWLTHLGVKVIATASSAEKLKTAKGLGASLGINYSETDFVPAVMEWTSGHGVDIAFDAVGKTTLSKTLDALAARGTAVSYGGASGPPPAIETNRLIEKAKRLAGASLFVYIADVRELQERAAEVIVGIEEGWLRMPKATGYSLDAAAEAHAALESRRTEGKLFLSPKR